MTQPRRPDELAFYAELRSAAAAFHHDDGRTGTGYWGGATVAKKAAAELGIPENRAFYLLEKWYSKGWLECGMWVWGGWFTEHAPETLSP